MFVTVIELARLRKSHCLLALSIFAGAAPAMARGWWRVETEWVTIYTDASSSTATRLAEQVVAIQKSVDLITGEEAIFRRPFILVAIDSEREFTRFQKLVDQDKMLDDGLVMHSRWVDQIWGGTGLMRASVGRRAMDNDWLNPAQWALRGHSYRLSRWLGNGLASVVGAVDLNNTELVLGKRNDGSLSTLQKYRVLSVSALLGLGDNPSNPFKHDSNPYSYLAHCWLLTHYLLWGHEDWTESQQKEAFRKILAELKRGRDELTVISEVMQIAPEDLDSAVKKHYRSGVLGGPVWRMAWPKEERNFTPQELDSGAEDVARAYAFMAIHEPNSAESLLRQVIAASHSDEVEGRAWLALGDLALANRKVQDAGERYSEAARHGVKPPRIALWQGLMASSLWNGGTPTIDPGALEQAANAFREFAQSRPYSLEGLNPYAQVLVQLPTATDFDLKAMKRALQANPQNPYVHLALGVHEIRRGETERGTHRLNSVIEACRETLPAIAQMAEQAMGRAASGGQLEEVEKLLAGGDITAAQERFDTLNARMIEDRENYARLRHLLDRYTAVSDARRYLTAGKKSLARIRLEDAAGDPTPASLATAIEALAAAITEAP